MPNNKGLVELISRVETFELFQFTICRIIFDSIAIDKESLLSRVKLFRYSLLV